jgi:hypothetical protein
MAQKFIAKFPNTKFHTEMFSSFWVAYIQAGGQAQ